MSATGIPSLPRFRMNAFCASENLDAFIVFRSSQPGNQTRKTLAKNGPVYWEQISIGLRNVARHIASAFVDRAWYFSFGEHRGFSVQGSQSYLLARYMSVAPSFTSVPLHVSI